MLDIGWLFRWLIRFVRLEPGGYLQWEDVDIGRRFGPETGSKILIQAKAIFDDFLIQQGSLKHLPPILGEELRAHSDIESVLEFSYDTFARRDLKTLVNEVYFDAIRLVLVLVQKKMEKYKDLHVDELMGQMKEEFEEKDLIVGDICTVFVARKKL